MNTQATDAAAIRPVERYERRLSDFDLALIWFGAAISIGEIWGGGLPQLTVLGLGAGLAAIVLGRIVGNGLMAAMARIGARTGLPTMVLTRPALGIRGSYILAGANVLQLVGWTGWMVYIAAEYTATLLGGGEVSDLAAKQTYTKVAIVVIGALCTWWALSFAGQRWWKWLERISSVLLLLLTIGMTYLVLGETSRSQFDSGQGSWLGLLLGMDIVIAMSVSWLPLVADYSRYSRSERGGAAGTFWGYFVGGTWMYAVGLLVGLARSTDTPDQAVVQILSTQYGAGWFLLALGMIVLSTTTTTFLDIYSAAISAQSLWPRISGRAGTLWCGVLGTLFALVLDVNAYAPFLTAIGAIFLPAFSVVLADYFLLRNTVDPTQLDVRGGRYWYSRGFNWRAIAAWLVGFLVYDWAGGFSNLLQFYGGLSALLHLPVVNPAIRAFPYGASLPCILATVTVYLALSRLIPARAIRA